MSKNKKYRIKARDFKKLEKLAERIYNTAVVLDYFCSMQQKIEELYNITPIVANLRSDADAVNAYFINYPKHDIKTIILYRSKGVQNPLY